MEIKDYHIVIVDDDPVDANMLAQMAALTKHRVTSYDDPYRALQAFMKEPADLVVTDLNMPHINGFEMIKKMRERAPAANFIMVTGEKNMRSVIESRGLGVDYIFFKPVRINEFTAAIETMFNRFRYWIDKIKEVELLHCSE
ncbi:MAG: response regulator [Deltaproteobacteria bacterium]|nr:response regulator [Deltaproteobacteria bacterium]MBF0523643.1 response regulator [Deltaproteobacteria bacterium]